MESSRWTQMCDEARKEELDARANTFDPGRPPLPVAISTRMMVRAYDRIIALEERVKKLDKLDAKKLPDPNGREDNIALK